MMKLTGHKCWLGAVTWLVAACATPSLTWQEKMDEARTLADRGEAYVLVLPSEVQVFYNRPLPFCYTYTIPGEWVSKGANEYESKDGRTTVVVQFGLPEHVSGLPGVTLVERARTYVTRDYEKAIGKPIQASLTPFVTGRAFVRGVGRRSSSRTIRIDESVFRRRSSSISVPKGSP